MEIVIISNPSFLLKKGKAYNVKNNEIFKIDYSTTDKIFLKNEEGYLTYGIHNRLLPYRVSLDSLAIGELSIVKKINNKEGVVTLNELNDLQKYIDSAILYKKKIDDQNKLNKRNNEKLAEEAKKNYTELGL